MTKKINLEIGIQEFNVYSKCIGCDIKGSVFPSDIPQTINLIITHFDDRGKEKGKEPLCLLCAGDVMLAIRQEMFVPPMDEAQRRRYKELSDWFNNLANHKKR